MTESDSPLSDDDVRQIAQLMETLENSDMDFLQVELGGLKVTMGKGDASAIAVTPHAEGKSSPSVRTEVTAEARPKFKPETKPVNEVTSSAEDGTITITAPMLGRFYAQSEPGAEPFINVGDEVGLETTVALIEVMKMFTAVTAGMTGVITEIYVQNEEIVEFGQDLFRVRPL